LGRYDAELNLLEEEQRGFAVLACVGTLAEETSESLVEAGKKAMRGPVPPEASAAAAAPAAAAPAAPRTARSLAINLSGVTYMSSVGLGALLELYAFARANGVRLALFGAKAETLRLFHYTAIDEVIPHFATEEEALGRLARGPEEEAG